MRITDLLDKRSISLNASPATKQEALDQAIRLMEKRGNIRDHQAYRNAVFAREEESTTGIGEGIAIPHGKSSAVSRPGLAAVVVKNGVDFDSLDGEPVHLIFLIAAPDSEENVHLDVLSRLSRLLMKETFGKKLMEAKTAEAFLAVINEADEDLQKDRTVAQADSQREGTAVQADSRGRGTAVPSDLAEQESRRMTRRILAVTSCPTGIAHTYMAAEGLEKAARAGGYQIKVETRGSGGAKNVLTDQEIAEADCIIVAADAKVPMERFHGKRVIECAVSDGINRAEQLLEQAVSGDVPVYDAKGAGAAYDVGGRRAGSMESGSRVVGNPGAGSLETGSPGTGRSRGFGTGGRKLWHQLYMQLMNGVSHMLPFVVGGGILIALAFLIDGLQVDIHALSAAERGNFGSITPMAATLKQIGDLAFGFMLPVLAGFIAMSIGDRPALAPGFVGGMIAASGKSGFLGALAAGFLAGYLIRLLRLLFDRLPNALEKIAPVLLYPLFGILLVGLIMNYGVEPPIGGLNTALNRALTNMNSSSRILLGILVAGMMAVDMGGPFNKAAYVFGTASIAAGNYHIMAAVMIGGMVPPCAIALATMLFRNKFTKEERESGPVNFIMGLAFITEGAIPYAAADPLRVLPSCIIGSAAAGALSMAFGCMLMAPHGGIFVFPVVEQPLLYLAALAAGTVIGAVLLGILKRNVDA